MCGGGCEPLHTYLSVLCTYCEKKKSRGETKEEGEDWEFKM